ncbi:GDP-mannose transporter GONST1 [Phragmites australis]|uniref:GDP-mannose transporter GONST1 n=1 Tax=Phragmites australis TaxID=29695 RepID=UPI002D77A58A|nr:GDP-mannose transporter GONST1 [Phragmites australis]
MREASSPPPRHFPRHLAARVHLGPTPSVMGSRILQLDIPADSEASPRRNVPGSVSSPLMNGEKSVFRDQNAGFTALASPVRREIGNRSMTRSFCVDDNDLEDGKASKDRDRPSQFLRLPNIQNRALLSGLAYCISSCSMILVNKFVLSGYGFNAPIFLMLYQNIVSVTIVSTLSLSGAIPTEPLTWKLIKVWLPVNIIFVGMLITSMFSLKYINVAMLTILKNVANVLTASGETYFFNKHHGTQVWIALILMIISAAAGGVTDLSFHAVGYTWQIINCFLTASYSLTLRHVMDSAKQATKSGNLNELSMVLLNNILSLPLGIILVLGFNEVEYLLETPLLRMPEFWLVITASGVLGLAISFTSMWFLHQTSATTYSLVGSLNKIPLSVAGIVLFKVRTSMENSLSILFGLLAGVFFARAKLRDNSPS